MMMVCSISLASCTKNVGDFCDAYIVVDMPRYEAEKVNEPYRSRILINELYEHRQCN